jgi:hypothetical protein
LQVAKSLAAFTYVAAPTIVTIFPDAGARYVEDGLVVSSDHKSFSS